MDRREYLKQLEKRLLEQTEKEFVDRFGKEPEEKGECTLDEIDTLQDFEVEESIEELEAYFKGEVI